MGMKGHPQSNCNCGGVGGGGGWMKKKRMAIVAVVILVGLMGVMVVQKVRDRRLFNLVIKDKDRQILSLHLLLQKERQYSKENKRKNQDLNAKLYSLRTQKIELNNKLVEMRSTIGSMRDEQRALELAIDEKKDEIKHKESQIKDLKINLQTPPKIWSVSSDDPSNHEVNLTDKVTTNKVNSRFGQSNIGQKPNQQSVVEGNKQIINPNVKVQKPKDNAKNKMHNTTDGGSEENGNGLSIKGRRFFIGASENQRDKSLITKTDGQNKKSQLKENPEEGPKSEADRMDEDEAEIEEADMNSSRNGSEVDQDYKEEIEE